jgi:hypothetical protein
MLTSTKVRDFLDLMLADSKDSTWSRPLLFPCAVVAPGESCSGPLVFTEDNICKYTESLYKGFKLYFDFEKYKVSGTTTIEAKDPAWKVLCADLMRSAHSTAGTVIVSNGKDGQGYRKLICHRGIFCDKSFCGDAENGTYRMSSLNADYKNRRKNGKKLDRRTSTSKPILQHGETTCKWKLLFSCDAQGFFLRCGLGCGSHHGHSPPLENSLASTRKSLLQHSEVETMKYLGGAHANAGVGRNFLFNKTGKFISTSQARYLYSDPWKLPRPTDGARPLDDVDVSTPPCQLLENFRRRNDICYSCLFSDAPHSSGKL